MDGYNEYMAPLTRQLLDRALKLPISDRAYLIGSLIESLDTQQDAKAQQLWEAEIVRRIDEMDQGSVNPMSWPRVRTRLRGALRGRA